MHPDDLPSLLAPVVSGAADYAKGNRFAWPGAWRAMPPVRVAGSVVLSLLTRLASGYWHVFDSQCGYTVASRPRARAAIGPERMFARYGYPNDLLARLAAVERARGRRARAAGVRPRVAIGPAARPRVALPIAGLLLRGWWRRIRAEASASPASPS